MPANRQATKNKIKAAMDAQSGNSEINPTEARNILAQEFADAVFNAMIGRTVTVTGTTSNGGTFTTTGTIIE